MKCIFFGRAIDVGVFYCIMKMFGKYGFMNLYSFSTMGASNFLYVTFMYYEMNNFEIIVIYFMNRSIFIIYNR